MKNEGRKVEHVITKHGWYNKIAETNMEIHFIFHLSNNYFFIFKF